MQESVQTNRAEDIFFIRMLRHASYAAFQSNFSAWNNCKSNLQRLWRPKTSSHIWCRKVQFCRAPFRQHIFDHRRPSTKAKWSDTFPIRFASQDAAELGEGRRFEARALDSWENRTKYTRLFRFCPEAQSPESWLECGAAACRAARFSRTKRHPKMRNYRDVLLKIQKLEAKIRVKN